MKSVLISIQPCWCELIAIGKKKLEVRKTRTKLKAPFKCYIYCTKSGEILSYESYCGFDMDDFTNDFIANGHVIGEFICSDIDHIGYVGTFDGAKKVIWLGIYDRITNWWRKFDLSPTCMSEEQITRYLSGEDGFAYHISGLKIYEKPKSLEEFGLNRPPQSWCYVNEVV